MIIGPIRSTRSTWTTQRFAVALFVLIASLLGFADSANGHAQVASTEPATGARLATAPREVVVTFTESVRIEPAGIRVLNETGNRVDTGGVKLAGRRASVALGTIPNGPYVTIWEAISADGHPIRGSFTFQVGPGSQAKVAELGAKALTVSATARATRVALLIVRAIAFVSMLLLLGLAGWRLVGLPDLFDRSIRWGQLIAVSSGGAAVLIDGPYVSRLPLSRVRDVSLLTDSLSRLTVRSLAAAIVVSFLLGESLRRRGQSLKRVELGGAIVGLSLLLAATGHAAAGTNIALTIVITALHIAAGSMWVGGLVVLTVRWRYLDVPQLLRWSTTATVSVVVLAATGIANSLRQVGMRRALTETFYGNLLLVKLSLIGIMLLLAAWQRRRLHRSKDIDGKVAVRGRHVGLEAVVGIGVIVISTWLSSVVPARVTVSRPITVKVNLATTDVDVTVQPARRGRNTLHVYVFGSNGLPTEITDITMVLTHVATDATLEIDPVRAGTGHEQARGVELPFAGSWTADIKVYISDFEVETGTASIVIR